MMVAPEQGDFVFINFDPQSGHEQAGHRPAIVLSHKTFNASSGFAIVCPITRQQKGYPFEIPIPDGESIEGVILTDQVKSLDWQHRRLRIRGQASSEVLDDCLTLIKTLFSKDDEE